MIKLQKTVQFILLFLVLLATSCSNKEKNITQKNEISTNSISELKTITLSEMTKPDSVYKYFSNTKYIAFIKNDMFISLFEFTGKTNYSDYNNEKVLYSNTQEEPIWFLDLVNDLLILDEGTSPNPHTILFYDIKNNLNIFDGYLYKNYYEIKDNKITILKEIGNRITKEDYKKIPKNIQNKIQEFILEDKQNENYLIYYHEYTFDFTTRKIEPLNLIHVTSAW